MKTIRPLAAFVLASLLAACAPAAAPAPEDGRLRIAATIYPLAYLAGRIAGEDATVTQLTPGGVEPHDFEPTPAQIAGLHGADILLLNGGGIDAWAEHARPELEAAGVAVAAMTEHVETIAGSHDEHADEEHADEDREDDAIDPHVWLDPARMRDGADAILAEVLAADPAHADGYMARYEALQADLSALDAEMAAGLRTCALRTVIVSHDAFGYLAARYGFETLPIAGFSPEEEPSPARIAELAGLAEEKGIRHVFFETLASPKLSETLAEEAGASVLVLNPIEGLTPEEIAAGADYASVMRENLANLRTAMECS